MEFNIRGILDENGQLQSVQSSCSNTPLDGLPFSSPFRLQGTEVTESKVVDYAVKKDLDRKLYAKVNEMSDMMIHLKHVQDSLDTSKKLNKEYEDKIKRLTKQITELQTLNANLTKLVKEHNIPLPNTQDSADWSNTFPKYHEQSSVRRRSSSSSSGTIPKMVRTSTTEITIGLRHSEIDTIDGACAIDGLTRDQEKTKQNADSEKNKVSDSPISKILVSSYVKPKRPNKLEIPKSFKSKVPYKTESSDIVPPSDKDNNGEIHKSAEEASNFTITGDNDHCSNMACPNNVEIQKRTTATRHSESLDATQKPDHIDTCNLLYDEEGYLIFMLPTNKTVLHRSKATRRKSTETGNPPPEAEATSVDPRFCSECHCDTDIHVRWIDFHNCRNSSGSPDSPVGKPNTVSNESPEIEDSFQPVFAPVHSTLPTQNVYVEIPDDIDEQVSRKEATSTDDKDLDVKYATRAPVPLPRDRSENVDLDSPCSPNNCAIKEPCYLSPINEKQQDKPNNVMKTMRMTSEWQSAKKELLERCHTCTSQDAENTLRSVVKRSIEVFQKEIEGSSKRSSKNLSEKLVRYIKESLVDDHEDDVITVEFLQKVVQLCDREFL